MRKQIKSLKSKNLIDSALFKEISGLIMAAQNAVVRNIDTVQVLTNYEIGRRIVAHEQKGLSRAEYGKETLKDLSEKLTAEFGKGFSGG